MAASAAYAASVSRLSPVQVERIVLDAAMRSRENWRAALVARPVPMHSPSMDDSDDEELVDQTNCNRFATPARPSVFGHF